jgi:hypothetical protein
MTRIMIGACLLFILCLNGLSAQAQDDPIGVCCTIYECTHLTYWECIVEPGSYTWWEGNEPCDPNPCPQ